MPDLQNILKSSPEQSNFDTDSTPHLRDSVRGNPSSEIDFKVYFDTQSAIAEFEQEVRTQSPKDHLGQVGLLLKNADTLLSHKEVHLGMALLRQASNIDSWNTETLQRLGASLELIGNFSEAEKAWKALVKVDNRTETLFSLAHCLYKLNKDEEALEKYYEGLAILTNESTEVFEAYKNMGNILVRRGDFEGAEELYNKAYAMNPSSDILLVNLGTLEVQRQDFDKAIYCFRKAVEINCDNDKAWVGLALVHNQYGDQDLAWANAETAVEINPTNRTAVHVIAAWGMRDQKVQRAIPVLESYLAQVDFDEDMSLVLINLYCHQGLLDQAKIEIEKVLLWNPAHSEVRELRKKLRNYKKGAA